MLRYRRLLPVLLGLALVLPAATADAQSTRVPLSYDAPELADVGRLAWRGGLQLSGDADWFGGLSALEFDESSETLIALTDRGVWLRLAIEHDARGFLRAAHPVIARPLDDVDGRPFRRKADRDSESLAGLPDGGFVVAFEQRHQQLAYPPAEPPFARRPYYLGLPPGLYGAPGNGGLEALVALAEGRLLALSEKLYLKDGTALGWLGDGRRWMPLRYRTGTDFSATGATRLPSGDVLVLERRLSLVGGFAARLVRLTQVAIEAADADPASSLVGDEIALLQAPLNMDNFEGIATRRAANGETLIYLVSDDNFFALQRTLLFAFALRDTPVSTALPEPRQPPK